MKRRKDSFYLILALPSLIVTLFIFSTPLFTLISTAFKDGGLELINVLTDSYTYRLLFFSITEALISAILSLLIALPFALFFSSYTFFSRSLILAIANAAFALPSIIAVLGFIIWYGNNGLLNKLISLLSSGRINIHVLYSFSAIILCHIYLNFPLAFSLLTTSFMNQSDEEEKCSLSLGKSKLQTFLRITLNKSKGTISSSFLLIFLYCFSSFLIVMTLGGKTNYYTIEAEIYRRTIIDGNNISAASLSLFSFTFLSLLLLLVGYGKEKKKIDRRIKELKKAKGKKLLLSILLSLLILLFILPPILSIFYRAFFTKDGTFTLKAWLAIINGGRNGISTSLKAIINSIVIALFSSFLSTHISQNLALASVKTKSRLIPLLSSLPIALGSVSLGLGFSFFSSALKVESEIGRFIIIILSHTAITLPFSIRTIMPGAKSISEELTLVSLTLNSGKMKALRRVEYPLLKDWRRRAFAFCFALSVGETNSTISLGEGKITTLPILIYKMINQYNYQGAAALSILLIVLTVIVFVLTERRKINVSGS